MDDEWDADDFVPLPPVSAKDEPKTTSQWDDEDVEDELKEEAKPEPVIAPKPKKKFKKNIDDEGDLSDPIAEKLRQQRLVEEADYQNTSELFGDKSRTGHSLEYFIPKSEEDFLDYAELIAQKIRPFEKSFHYMTLLRALLRHSVAAVKASDAKEFASSMTVIANEKLKAEKDATAGKKKTGAKKAAYG